MKSKLICDEEVLYLLSKAKKITGLAIDEIIKESIEQWCEEHDIHADSEEDED
jgi:hypothetical protein